MTDGRKGHPRFPADWTEAQIRNAEDDLVNERKQEAALAGRILGIEESIFLEYPDGSLQATLDAARRLKGFLDSISPEVVYLPSLLDAHEDHWQTNCLFHLAISGAVERPEAPFMCRGYEVWSPAPANQYVDITEFVNRKTEAMQQCKSQLKETDLIRPLIALNSYRSLLLMGGKGYAEAFFSCSVAEYRVLFDHVRGKKAT
jgi:LmbE family N-acetylglucosaminyl deacetylase